MKELPTKKQILWWVYGLAISIIFSACGRPVEHSKYIPKEANYVLSINMPKIQEKAVDWEYLFNRDVLQLFINVKNTEAIKKNLKTSGIEFGSPVYVFGQEFENGEDDYFALSFKLKSESEFDNFLRQFPEQNLRIRTFSGMRYVVIDEKTILGWMNRAALLIVRKKKANEDVLKNRMIKLRDLPEEYSLLKDKSTQFRILKQQNHDVAVWLNLESYEEKLKNMVSDFPLPLNFDMEQNYLTMSMDFEQGKINTSIQFYNQNNSFAHYGRLVKDELNQSLFNALDTKDRIALTGIALDMKGVKNLFYNLGGSIFEGQTQAYAGVNPGELLEMFTGDFVAYIKNIQPTSDSTETFSLDYSMAMGIKKWDTFFSITQKLKENQELVKVDSNTYFMPSQQLYWTYNASMLYITPSKALKDTFIEGNKSSKLNFGKKNCWVLFTDLREETRQKLPQAFFGEDRFLEGMIKYTKTPFESISVSLQPLRNKKASAKVIIQLKDRKQNALETLAASLKPRKPS